MTKEVNQKPQGLRLLIATVPLFLLIPILTAVTMVHFGIPFHWDAFGIGAAGWMLALTLRAPIGAAVRKMPRERASRVLLFASGPCEELVRLLALALAGRSSSVAASIGQGWAVIEIVLALVNGFAILLLVNRDDEKARQAREILQASGTYNRSPFWGLWERVGASAYHIGSTLLLAGNFWWIIPLIPLHSFVNYATTSQIKRSMSQGLSFLTAVGGLSVFLGLLLYGPR